LIRPFFIKQQSLVLKFWKMDQEAKANSPLAGLRPPPVPARGFFKKHRDLDVQKELSRIRSKRRTECLKLAVTPALRRNTMKSSTQDQVEGKLHEAKGKVKEMAGKITDNPKLEVKGKAENIAGKVQEKIGQVKKVLGK
jgi:uncharacterized protein YjbJ (UPF0337 family)